MAAASSASSFFHCCDNTCTEKFFPHSATIRDVNEEASNSQDDNERSIE
jgi:hypothetical protein